MSGYFEGLVGTRLGGYTLRRMIARGGMGVVYESHQESLNRSVAIKILYPHLSDDAGFRERFQREARALAQLTHPHIVRVIDFDVSQALVYMVMELVDGHSLRDELISLREQGRVIGVPRAMEILQAVGLALTFAHERGFVHRDVKPGNVLIDKSGQVFLTDFGLVKLEEVAGVTATGAVMGTPEYMAPEQFLATSAAGPAADQYALAVVAYEMLVGRVPFSAPTPVGLLQKHLDDDPPSMRDLDANLPEAVEPVIRRGLAKDPNARYPNVAGFVRDLHASTTTTLELPSAAAAETLTEPARSEVETSPLQAPVPVVAPAPVLSAAPSIQTLAVQPVPTPVSTPATPAAPVAAPPAAGGGGAPPRAASPTAQSSRPGWLKWVLIGAIPLLLLGGLAASMLGGGGGDDPDPTPTTLAVVEPTSTGSAPDSPTATAQTAVESTATTASEPTPTEPIAPTATTAPSEPTPTRPPVVVTREIPGFPTPTTGIIITVPTPGSDEEFTTVVNSDFVEGEDLSIWAITTDDPAFSAQIIDGHFVIDIVDAPSVTAYPSGTNDISGGAMAVRVRVEGDGAAGVMLRRSETADGLVSLYECHVTNTQEFSCWKQVNGDWSEIVTLTYNAAIIPNDYNTIAIGAVGSEFNLQINDVDVASWTDDSIASGNWGLYTELNTGGASVRAYYDVVLIVRDY
ncbi:MAG: protein kinase [Thermomicrobiales bacterium]